MYPVKKTCLQALVISALILLVIALPLPGSPARQQDRQVALTFAFFGCNRIEAKDWEETRTENPSSANLPQLRQNLADVAKLSPDFLFFGGDVVMGYADDQGDVLRSQM